MKVVESVCYSARIVGGSFSNDVISIAARREGRRYYADVYLRSSNGGLVGLNEAIPNASGKAGSDTPKGALDCGFKSAYFYLNSLCGRAKLADVEQSSIYWVLLDESGRRVYDWQMNMSEEECKAWQNEVYPYVPPRGEGHFVEVEIGRSRSVDGAISPVDGISAAESGKNMGTTATLTTSDGYKMFLEGSMSPEARS